MRVQLLPFVVLSINICVAGACTNSSEAEASFTSLAVEEAVQSTSDAVEEVVSMAAVQEEIGLAREWVCPAHIDRTDNLMRIFFHPNGRLEFFNGFESHNPARWEYLPDEQAIVMHLPALDEHVDRVLRDYKARGFIKDYCYEENTLTYWFRGRVRNFIFFGFSFNARG